MTNHLSSLGKAIPAGRAEIMRLFKERGKMSIADVADALGVSNEAARKQIQTLISAGWLQSKLVRKQDGHFGRPISVYSLSEAGDHLFPKNYDGLAATLIKVVDTTLGEESLHQIFTSLTDAQVQLWSAKLEGKSLEQKLDALRSIYLSGDPWTEIIQDDKGICLVEHNCPYLNVALQHPRLCSFTVSVLTRLLGYRVEREKRFQDGDQKCVFRIRTDCPVEESSFTFEFES